jgi:PAS domain S-box-containing protein
VDIHHVFPHDNHYSSVGYVLVQRKIDKSVLYTKTLSYSSSQGALGYELANETYQLSKGKLPHMHGWKLGQKLGVWNKVQLALQNSNGNYGLSLSLGKQTAKLFADIAPLQKQLSSHIAWVSIHPNDVATATYVLQNMGEYVSGMNEVSKIVQMDAEVDLLSLRRQEKQLAIISAIILLLEMLALVAPYHKKLLTAYQELKVRKRQLEVNKKIVEDLNNAQNLMIAGINAGVWDSNMVTGRERWSERLYGLIGYERDSVPADSHHFINELVHKDDRDKIVQAALMHFKYRKPYSVEARVMTGEGEYKWFEISGQAQWNNEGRAVRISGSVLDIDDNVRYRRRLEYSDFMLEEVGKLAKVGGWEYDIMNNRIMWTKGMYEINEVSPDDTSVLEYLLDNYAEDHQNLIQKVIQHTSGADKAYDEELKLITAKGNERWVRVIGKAQYDTAHKLTRVRGVYQDIHTKKLKEIELEKTRQDLYNSNKTKDKLLSIIAHDLRSPLNNIKSLIELKSADVISFEEFTNYLDDMKVSIAQVSDAMENMLQWAFTQKDGFTANKSKVNIMDTATMAADLYTRSFQDKHIAFSNNASTEHFANADANHVFLILRNLINNAIKFTPENGSITIETGQQGDVVRISVRDTGVGMTAEQLDSLRKHASLQSTHGTNGEGGTGLGLNFCFEIAEKGGGHIEVASEQGKGSVFTLVLPVWKNEDGIKKVSGNSMVAS